MTKLIERDCGIFSGGTILKNATVKENISESLNDYEGYYVIEILTGDASSIDNGKTVNGGTAITTDKLKFSGGDSSF